MSSKKKMPKDPVKSYEDMFVEAVCVTLDEDLRKLYRFAVDSRIANVELVRQLLMIQQTRTLGRARSLPSSASSK